MRYSSLTRALALTLACTTFSFSTSCVIIDLKPAPLPLEMREAVQSPGAVLIVHEGSSRFRLDAFTLDSQRFILKGVPIPLESEYGLSETLSEKLQHEGGTVLRGQKYRVENEVHIYLNSPGLTEGAERVLTMQQIDRVLVYDRNVPATLATYVLGGLGVAATGFALLVAVILLTKSFCPFVYVNNGKTFKFTGELYGGAIFPYLERDDYLPLPELEPSPNGLELLIANRLLQRQYTDLAELVVVTHPKGTRALLDASGQAHVLDASLPPGSARTGAGSDRRSTVLATDGEVYRFEELAPAAQSIGQLDLTFARPTQAPRLVLNTRSSPWLDFAYGEVTRKFGHTFDAWQASERTRAKDTAERWSDEQSVPLSILVETDRGWKKISQLEPIGPLASRDVVVPIPLEGVVGDTLHIRLQTGFQFWEVDSVQLDVGVLPPVKVTRHAPSTAIDQSGADVSDLLRTSDGRYLEQPSLDMEALLTFPSVPAPEGLTQSYFLHARGYYEHIRDFTHAPARLELLALKRPGAFPRFSEALFRRLVGSSGAPDEVRQP